MSFLTYDKLPNLSHNLLLYTKSPELLDEWPSCTGLSGVEKSFNLVIILTGVLTS